MATPKKLPSGNWNIVVYSHKDENGKPRYVSFTAPTKAETNRLALEFQINKKNEGKPQNITVGKAVDDYIESKSNILAHDTLREYKNYKKYYTSVENIMIGNLESLDLQKLVNQLSKDKKPKTVRNIYSLLLSSIRLYSDRNFHVTLPQREAIEYHLPTDKDVSNLIENAHSRLKLAIILGSQGFRRGEISSLKYGDILRDFNAIYIHSDMILGENGWEYKETPKNSSSTRRVVLPKEVIDMLGQGDDDEYILGILPSTITTDFINLRNKLGLTCRFHDLRHYSASILHAIGVPDVYIMERGGWSSDSVLKSVYRNSLSDKSAHYTSIANEYFTKNILKENSERKDG